MAVSLNWGQFCGCRWSVRALLFGGSAPDSWKLSYSIVAATMGIVL